MHTGPDDPLSALATALIDYLTEIDGYRQTCLLHGTTAAMGEVLGLPCVRRRFRRTPELLDALRAAASGIPGWRASLFFRAGDTMWTEIQRETARTGPVLACQGLTFEGFPLLLRVTGDRRVITVDLLALPVPMTIPEHPLRFLAHLLRCHERLRPDRVRPLAASRRPERGWESVRRCAKRILTPYAGQRPAEGRTEEDSNV